MSPFPAPLRIWQSSSQSQHPAMPRVALQASACGNNWGTHVLSVCPYCSKKREDLQAVGGAGSSERHLPSAGTQVCRAELSARAQRVSAPLWHGSRWLYNRWAWAAEPVGPRTAPLQPFKLSAPARQWHTAPGTTTERSPGGTALEVTPQQKVGAAGSPGSH